MGKTTQIQMSPSSIGTLQDCAYKYYLKYILGIDVLEEAETLRFGAHWHRVLEILSMKPGTSCPECVIMQEENFSARSDSQDCMICAGTGVLPADMMTACVSYLNDAYKECPDYVDVDDWELEKVKILYAASAYRWYYANDELETVLREYAAEIPLIDTETGKAVRGVRLKLIVDKVGIRRGVVVIVEHKSTSQDISPDSMYWGKLALDIQTHMYPYAMRLIQSSKKMKLILGEKPVITVLYDVFKKPTTKPKLLSQGDTAAFVETGVYCGQTFHVVIDYNEGDNPTIRGIRVNNVPVKDFKPGKKEGTFAIRETAEMYGARLLQDIAENPEAYFARKPITRSSDDMNAFVEEMKMEAKTLRFRMNNKCWSKNPRQCENMYRCPFIDLCYNNVDVENGQLPGKYYRKERTNNASDKTTT